MALERSTRTNLDIVRNSVLVGLLSVAGLALGIASQAVIAAKFGTSGSLDAYWVALTVVAYTTGMYGTAVIDPFIPVYARQDKERQQHFLDACFTWTLLLGGAVILLTYLTAPLLTATAGSGFGATQLGESKRLVVILLTFPFLTYVVQFSTAVLFIIKAFTVPRSLALISPLLTISILQWKAVDWGVSALAWATLLGLAVQAALLLMLVRRANLRVGLTIRLLDPAMLALLKTSLPLLIAALITVVGLFLERSVASNLGDGAIAAIGYGQVLSARLVGVVFVPISTVVYPYLSDAWNSSEFGHRLGFALKFSILLLIPVAMLVGVFSEVMIRLLFVRGQFTASDAVTVSRVLMVFMIGMVPLALNVLVIRGLIVKGKVWFVTGWSTIGLAFKFLLLGSFARVWGPAGIPLFSSVFGYFSLLVSLLVLLMLTDTDRKPITELLLFTFKVLIVGAVGIALALGADNVLSGWTSDTTIGLFIRLSGVTAIYGLAMVFLIDLLRVYNVRPLIRTLLGKRKLAFSIEDIK